MGKNLNLRANIALGLVFTFLANIVGPCPVYAQDFNVNELPVPGTMVGESAPFTPLALKGLVINLQKPLEFQFIVDTGSSSVIASEGPHTGHSQLLRNQSLSTVIPTSSTVIPTSSTVIPTSSTVIPAKAGIHNQEQLKQQANQLVKYFLAGLTIPEGDLWVNLSPYEKNRMVPEALGQTDLGRDLLAQDYILKQLTASLIYPEKDLGKEFWSRVYSKAQQQFGTTNIPVNTFNKVWILPDQAQVFEHGAAAYVTKATLKVMLDEDYLALSHRVIPTSSTVIPTSSTVIPASSTVIPASSTVIPAKAGIQTHSLASNIIRQIILPEITKEVNTGKNFAPLRQIYQALILAKWYKETIQNGLLDAVYTNKNKVAGVNLVDPAVKEQIYERYLKAYKKGAFNYIKEDPTPEGQVVPRKYFSGGAYFAGKNFKVARDGAMSAVQDIGRAAEVDVNLDAAMLQSSTSGDEKIDESSVDATYVASRVKKSLREIVQVQLEQISKLETAKPQASKDDLESAWRGIAESALTLSYVKDDSVKALVQMVFKAPFSYPKGIALRALANVDSNNALSLAREWLASAANAKTQIDARMQRDMEIISQGEALPADLEEKEHDGWVTMGLNTKQIYDFPSSMWEAVDNYALIDATLEVLIKVKDPLAIPMIKKYLSSDFYGDNQNGAKLALEVGKNHELAVAARASIEAYDENFKRLVDEHQYNLDNPDSWGSGRLFDHRSAQIALALALAKLGDREYAISRLKEWLEFHLKLERTGRKLFDSSYSRAPIFQAAKALIDIGEEDYVVPILQTYFNEMIAVGEKTVGYDFDKRRAHRTYEYSALHRIIALLFQAKAPIALDLFRVEWARATTWGEVNEQEFVWESLLPLAEDIQFAPAVDFVKEHWNPQRPDQYTQIQRRDTLIGLGYPRAIHAALQALNGSLMEEDKQKSSIYERMKAAEILIKKFKLQEKTNMPNVRDNSSEIKATQRRIGGDEAMNGGKPSEDLAVSFMYGRLNRLMDYDPKTSYLGDGARKALFIIAAIVDGNKTYLMLHDQEETFNELRAQMKELFQKFLRERKKDFMIVEKLSRKVSTETKGDFGPGSEFDLRPGFMTLGVVLSQVDDFAKGDESIPRNRGLKFGADGSYVAFEKDSAMMHTHKVISKVNPTKNGGIDLNQINVKRTGKTINVQFNPAQLNELERGNFKGFTPVITGFKYIQSPFPLLGINNSAKEPEELTKA